MIKRYQAWILTGVLMTPFLLDLRFNHQIQNTLETKEKIHYILEDMKKFSRETYGLSPNREKGSVPIDVSEQFKAKFKEYSFNQMYVQNAFIEKGFVSVSLLLAPSNAACSFREESMVGNHMIKKVPDMKHPCKTEYSEYVFIL